MAKDLFIARLKAVPIFASMSKKEMDVVLRQADHLRYAPRQTVVREGEPGEESWMVVDGELAVQRGGQEVARLGPGDHFGELAVTDSTTRDATIVSTSPVELLLNIDRRRVWALVEGSPTLMRKVIVGLAHRLHEMDAADTAARLVKSGEAG
jgi:CRP-like cAMP-binding protein